MRIWKYKFPIQFDPIDAETPIDFYPLSLQMQGDLPCLWAKVNPDMPKALRRFQWIATGHEFDDEATRDYVGTIQVGLFVFHLFEVH